MKPLFSGLFLSLLMFSCIYRSQEPASITQFIPENAQTIIRINDLESFKSDIESNEIISQISYLKQLNDDEQVLQHIQTINPILITLDKDAKEYTLITKFNDSLFPNSSLDSIGIHHQVVDSIFIASSSVDFNSQRLQKRTDLNFNKIHNSSNTNQCFSIYYKDGATIQTTDAFIGEMDLPFSDWIGLDIEIHSDDGIRVNGTAIISDTIDKGISIFKNSIPQENTLIKFSPAKIDFIKTISYNDYNSFHNNTINLFEINSDSINSNPFLETFNEVGVIQINSRTAIIAKSIDGSTTDDILIPMRVDEEQFRETSIFDLEHGENLFKDLDSLLEVAYPAYYFHIDDYFAFADSKDILKSIISSYRNRNTLDKHYSFRQNEEYLSSEYSLMEIVNGDKLTQKLRMIFNDSLIENKFDNYENSAFQIVQDDGFAHINAIIQKGSSKIASTGVNEVFNVSMEADLITSPQFVINHRTKQKEIVVQDLNNNLYLITNRGSILWKKRLQGKVMGKIEQVDLYKNGRLQLAFATSKRVYIIDRNGKDVSPFPLKFQDEITQPLSVFDYDNNRDYRFLVTQNNELLMYDRRGRLVRGFTYRSNKIPITTQPKHFRISNKDYIVFVANNVMKILNRRGQDRIRAKEGVSFSGNPVFNYRNTFTTTSNSGELIQVNLNGTVSKQSLNLGVNHKIDATSKTLVTSFENQLNIKLNNYELDFGEYSKPKIFYLNDKIYIAITDLQSGKLFLFDSQSRLLSHFPVYGNSEIDLANIDRDRNLEFVIQGESNSIIVYEMN